MNALVNTNIRQLHKSEETFSDVVVKMYVTNTKGTSLQLNSVCFSVCVCVCVCVCMCVCVT